MTERIILDIAHSDRYTDYLFQTAALRNHRVVPLVDPHAEFLRRLSGDTTLVVHCDNLRRDADKDGNLTRYEYLTDTIHVFSRSYLADYGSVNPSVAERARCEIEEHLDDCLLGPTNQQEVFREYFPLLWENRERIFSDPELFHVRYFNGNGGYPFGSIVYLGAILKAIATNVGYFRYDPPGGCPCKGHPVLVDYKKTFRKEVKWAIRTWCPTCHRKSTLIVEDFPQYPVCDGIIERVNDGFIDGSGFSGLNLLDAIERLKKA